MKDLPDPSKPLKNARREKFVEFVFAGNSAAEASRKAGYSIKGARQRGDQLLTNSDIAARITYLHEKSASSKVMTRRRAMEILTEIAEADLSDFLTVGADGVTYTDFGKDSAKRKALRKVKTKTIKDESGNTVLETQFNEIELEPRINALERLAKMMGWDEAKKIAFTEDQNGPVQQEQVKLIKSLRESIEAGRTEPVIDYTTRQNSATVSGTAGNAPQQGPVDADKAS